MFVLVRPRFFSPVDRSLCVWTTIGRSGKRSGLACPTVFVPQARVAGFGRWAGEVQGGRTGSEKELSDGEVRCPV